MREIESDDPRGQRGPRRLRGAPASEIRVGRVPRTERAAQIRRLREDDGLSFAQIADRMGLAVSTVYGYYADPTGERERERRERYRRRCKNPACGNLTSGANGLAGPLRFCPRCAALARRRWTEERVLEAIREWYGLTGSPPTLQDWSPAHAPADHEGAQRYLSGPGRWPSVPQVRARFGSFRAAVRAAGLEPARIGAPKRWTADEIVVALRDHAARHGVAPSGGDWAHTTEEHPARSTVYRAMGSWRGALEAAGLPTSRSTRGRSGESRGREGTRRGPRPGRG